MELFANCSNPIKDLFFRVSFEHFTDVRQKTTHVFSYVLSELLLNSKVTNEVKHSSLERSSGILSSDNVFHLSLFIDNIFCDLLIFDTFQDVFQSCDEIKRRFRCDQHTTELTSSIAQIWDKLNQTGNKSPILINVDSSNDHKEQVLNLLFLREILTDDIHHASILKDG